MMKEKHMTIPLKVLRHRIKNMPVDCHWWVKDSEETFNRVARDLLAKDFTIDEIMDILSRLYNAVTDDFGG